MPVNDWRGDLRRCHNKPPYQGKGKRRGKSSPVFGNKNAWQTPLGARLNRGDIAFLLKTVFS